MDLGDVMDEISTQLDTIADLNCFAWPVGSGKPPAAIVGYPTEYTYDETYARGMDRIKLSVVVLVGRPTDRSTRDAVALYVNGSGASSVKAVLEAGTYTAFDTIRVTGVDLDIYEEGSVKYLAAIFDLDIVGTGA